MMSAESSWRIAGAAVFVVACGWPEGLPSDSSYGDDGGSNDDTTTTTSTTTSTSSSSSTTSADGSADESSTTAPPSNFIQDPDGGNEECDIWEDDCPRGMKCMPWANDGGHAWNATKCTPIARDPNAPGEPCTVVESGVSGIDDCEAHAICWDVDHETNMGVCISFCTGSEANPICEDPNTSCSITSEGPLILCLPTCRPLLQDCAEGEGCYPINDGFGCAPDDSGKTGAFGDSCTASNTCDPSLFCAAAQWVPGCEDSTCCSSFCDLADPSCSPPQECVGWFDEGQAPPGLDDVGVCIVPEGN